MRILHEALEEAIAKMPEQVLGQLLREKLEAHGITIAPSELAQLQKLVLQGESDSLHVRRWRWWEQQKVVVEFSAQEVLEIERRLAEVSERIPQVIDDLSTELAVDILKTLQARWRGESRRQKREQAGFERRLLSWWGLPLELLGMLLTISREFGATVNEELRGPTGPSPYLLEVLTRLDARAIQVVHEIHVLLAAGLADGAIARWRTLHEIAAIALFVGEHGEDLAERYVLHEHVESRKAMRDYTDCHERLEYDSLEPGEITAVEQSYEGLLARFGRPYGAQYGWAAEQLGLSNPSLKDIERAAGIDHLRAHYRMTSHNVHANPKGAFFKLGLLEETDLLLSGPSNAGLADPGHFAAISLVQVSTPLGLLHPTLDNIVTLRIMLILEHAIGEAFGRAHEQLVHDSA